VAEDRGPPLRVQVDAESPQFLGGWSDCPGVSLTVPLAGSYDLRLHSSANCNFYYSGGTVRLGIKTGASAPLESGVGLCSDSQGSGGPNTITAERTIPPR
jgi:hypothetical protein